MASISTAFGGTVPQNYETYLGPLFFEPYAIDLVERLKGNEYKNVLELACGTGRVTKHLIAKTAVDGELCATDLNEGMLRIAAEKIKDKRVRWSVADAHKLNFPNDFFDLVICQFGVMFFADKPKAFAEAFRVLKPGGNFVFNTWNDVPYNDLACLTEKALQEVFPGDPPVFFMQGPHSFHDTDYIRQLLEEAGFVHIAIEKAAKTSVAVSPDDAIRGILDGTPISPYLKERSSQDARVRERLRELLVQHCGEKNLTLSMEAFVCQAAKPEDRL